MHHNQENFSHFSLQETGISMNRLLQANDETNHDNNLQKLREENKKYMEIHRIYPVKCDADRMDLSEILMLG